MTRSFLVSPAWSAALRTSAATLLGMVALSGIALSAHYVPSTDLAWDSIRAFEKDTTTGTLVRSMHVFGSASLIGVLIAMLVREALAADWSGTRHPRWYWTLALTFACIALGLTGELLPWTQQAVYATQVRVGVAESAPGADAVVALALGGDTIAGPALTRFHLLHVVLLPLALVGLGLWHRSLAAREAVRRGVPAGAVWRGLAGIAAGAALIAWADRTPAPLGAVHVPGDPYEPWPEWHFLWLNALLRLTPRSLHVVSAVVVPGLLVAGLVAAPWLVRTARLRAGWRVAVGLALAAMAGLSWYNAQHVPENPAVPVYDLSLREDLRDGYRIMRRERCLDCHQIGEYGKEQFSAPAFDDLDPEYPLDLFAATVRNPAEELGTEDMPAYDHLDDLEIRKLAFYLLSIQGTPD